MEEKDIDMKKLHSISNTKSTNEKTQNESSCSKDSTLSHRSKRVKTIFDSYLKSDDNNLDNFSIELSLDNNHLINKVIKDNKLEKEYCIFKVQYSKLGEISNLENKKASINWYLCKNIKKLRAFLSIVLKDPNLVSLAKENKEIILKIFNNKNQNIFQEFVSLFNHILKLHNKVKTNVYFLEFLELSIVSFSFLDLGIKYKEGYVIKHTKPIKNNDCCWYLFCCCLCKCKSFMKKWIIIKNDMLFFIDTSAENMGKDVSHIILNINIYII